MSSTDTQAHDNDAAQGPATYMVDAVVAVLVFLLGAVVIFGSRKLGAEWTTDGALRRRRQYRAATAAAAQTRQTRGTTNPTTMADEAAEVPAATTGARASAHLYRAPSKSIP